MIFVWSILSATMGVYMTGMVVLLVLGYSWFTILPGIIVVLCWLFVTYRCNKRLTLVLKNE